MNLKRLLDRFKLSSLRINSKFLEAEFTLKDADRDAAWELYVELLTRITTQPLPSEHGDEHTALNSVFSLFDITREILKRQGRDSVQFTKIAVIILNQIVRPFTAKWHKVDLNNVFSDELVRREFRNELECLRCHLVNYARLLSDLAEVEDLTELELN